MLRLKKALFPALIILIALWSVRGVLTDPGGMVLDKEDGLLITWILNQTIQKIPTDLGNIFQGNIFFPYKNTLAYSDLLIPSAILAYLPTRLSGEPLVAYNFSIVFGQVATLLVLYFFFKDVSKDSLSSFIATLAVGLSQIRFHYPVHIQMWSMYWSILSIWMIWKYFASKKYKFIYLSAVFLTIQTWESLLPLYFVGLAVVIFALRNLKFLWESKVHVLLAMFAFLVLSFPVFRVYYLVSSQFDYSRPIREAAHFSMSLDNLGNVYFSPALFLLFGVALILHSRIKRKSKDVRWFGLLALASLLMSLGPVLKWGGQTVKLFNNIFIPLPYGILYYILPGFGAFRTPSRWIWMFSFTLGGAVALSLSKTNRYKWLISTIAVVLLIAFVGKTPLPFKVPTTKEYPKVYKWLEGRNESVIVEYPTYNWANDHEAEEKLRMLYSTLHGKNLFIGSSGFYPPDKVEVVDEIMSDFPSDGLIEKLANEGVEFVLVHSSLVNNTKLSEIGKWGEKKEVYRGNKVVVYSIN